MVSRIADLSQSMSPSDWSSKLCAIVRDIIDSEEIEVYDAGHPEMRDDMICEKDLQFEEPQLPLNWIQ